MRMPVRRGTALGAALVLVATSGCGGGAARSAPAPRAPAGATQPSSQQGQPGPAAGYGQPGFAQPPASPEQPRRALDRGADDAVPTLADAELALDNAATRLASADNDCALACKALASMQRSADRICELSGPADPEQHCRRARARVADASARVKSGCGDCER